jgi:hypothetical protein
LCCRRWRLIWLLRRRLLWRLLCLCLLLLCLFSCSLLQLLLLLFLLIPPLLQLVNLTLHLCDNCCFLLLKVGWG